MASHLSGCALLRAASRIPRPRSAFRAETLEGLEVARSLCQRLRMAMPQHAVAKRFLHVRKFDEIEGRRHIDEAALRDGGRHRIDELCEPARLLDGEIDTLENLDPCLLYTSPSPRD